MTLIIRDPRKPVEKPTSASFLITEGCNLGCTYCFEKHNTNKMTLKVGEDAVNWLYDNAKYNIENGLEGREVHLMLFGGEPTLFPETLDKVMGTAYKLMKETGIKCTASMVTNATIMNDKLREVILEYKDKLDLSVQLSVDGVEKVQNMFRLTKDGRGSFDMVEKNIPLWKNLFKNDPNRLSIHGCCNKDNISYLFENYKFFREVWDLARIWFMPIHSEEWRKEDVDTYEAELNKIADYVLACAKRDGNPQEIYNYAPLDRSLNTRRGFSNKACGAGNNFVTITANGDVWPCHHFYFNDPNKELYFGNIYGEWHEERRTIFLDYDNSDMNCSKEDPECDCFNCYRCIADNWTNNGSLFSNDLGFRCQMSKIEKQIQDRVKAEVEAMGLLKGNQKQGWTEGDCLCNLGNPQGERMEMAPANMITPEQQQEHECKGKCGEGCKCGDEGFNPNEIIPDALIHILKGIEDIGKKLEGMEETQNFMLKKLLK